MAPNNNDNSRAQRTSADSAVNPDKAMVVYTAEASGVSVADSDDVSVFASGFEYGVLFARTRPTMATATLRAIATNVAIAMS